jgi:hypothetical protein
MNAPRRRTNEARQGAAQHREEAARYARVWSVELWAPPTSALQRSLPAPAVTGISISSERVR